MGQDARPIGGREERHIRPSGRVASGGPPVTPVRRPAGLVRTYVDETGDRGVTGKRASRFFAMVAVSVADEDDHLLRAVVQRARQDFRVPANKPLHWTEHVKSFARRQAITEWLSTLPVVLNVVVFEKASIPAQAVLRTNQRHFYNYAAGLLLERVLFTADGWHGGPRRAVVQFGHVRGFNHAETLEYFGKKQMRDSTVPWSLLNAAPTFLDSGARDGLQAADQYAGMLSRAIVADEFGGFEPQHLLAVRHQIRRDPRGRCDGWGFKTMVAPTTMKSFPWWPTGGL